MRASVLALIPPVLLAITACTEEDGVGDGVLAVMVLEPADRDDIDDPEPAPGQDGFFHAECHQDVESYAMGFQARGGANRVDVVHTGVWSPCETSWSVSAVMHEGRIEVSYVQDAASSQCTCQNTLSYVFFGVPSGTWTIVEGVDGQEAEVEVTDG